jgi:uncharacterized protein YggE
MSRTSLAVIGIVALLVLGGVAIGGLGNAGAQSTDDSPGDRTITVSATGSAQTSPNQAVVRVAVTAEGDDAAQVRNSLATDADNLRTALDELGVTYETNRYGIEEQRHPPRQERERAETGDEPTYRGIHAFTVTLDDPETTGAVIQATTGADAEVNTVQLTLSDQRRSELRNQAIKNAMSDAQTQATTIATAGNLSVSSVASVDASERRYRPVQVEMAADVGGDDGSAPTVIDNGEVSVSYNVEVTYNATTP